MRKLLGVALLFVALFACAGPVRPEGTVEKWLLAINQGPIGHPERYAADPITRRIIAGHRVSGSLEVIEVGRGKVTGDRADVPFKVRRKSGTIIQAVATAEKKEGSWLIVAVDPNRDDLKVPSAGGERIGRASQWAWLAGLGAAGALILITTVLIDLADPRSERRPRARK